jgi:hypothetical protein
MTHFTYDEHLLTAAKKTAVAGIGLSFGII